MRNHVENRHECLVQGLKAWNKHFICQAKTPRALGPGCLRTAHAHVARKCARYARKMTISIRTTETLVKLYIVRARRKVARDVQNNRSFKYHAKYCNKYVEVS